MRRLLTASALFALALAVTATGREPTSIYRERTVVESDYPFPFRAEFARAQPPGTDKKAAAPAEKAEKKAADPTDAAIAAALANDADVKMAKAKIQLAEAELTKARQTVTLRVVTLKGKIEQLKGELKSAETRYALIAQSVKAGAETQSALHDPRDKLEAAKAALAAAEAELKLLTGSATTSGTADSAYDKTVTSALQHLGVSVASDAAALERLTRYMAVMDLVQARAAVKGPIPDRIRAALDKPVKLGAKGEKVTFAQAAATFKKEAGLDIPVREQAKLNAIISEGEELPVGAWFQLFADGNLDARFLVREYGLLIAPKEMAPPDALGVVEFWKQKVPPPVAKTEAPK
jgi:hypothetical protein